MAREKKADDPPKGAPMWVMTFGDLMSLLLTFFILIVSFSSMQEAGFKQALGSLQGALGILESHGGQFVMPSIVHPEAFYAFLANRLRQTTGDVSEKLNFLSDIEGAQIQYDDRGMHIVVPASILFASGSATLSENAARGLRRIGAFLYENKTSFSIEGHTDNIPPREDLFASNWELSTARAVNVMHFFYQACAIPYERMSVAGYAEFKPVASNDTPEGREKNRRVEIIVNTRDKSQYLSLPSS